MDYSLTNFNDIYDDKKQKNEYIMHIENEYNDHVKKIIFYANKKNIYKCKIIFYSNYITEINLNEYIVIYEDITYINLCWLIYDGYHSIVNIIKLNDEDDDNIFSIYDDSTTNIKYSGNIDYDRAYTINNKSILRIYEHYIFSELNDNYDDVILELNFIKSLQYFPINDICNDKEIFFASCYYSDYINLNLKYLRNYNLTNLDKIIPKGIIIIKSTEYKIDYYDKKYNNNTNIIKQDIYIEYFYNKK